MTLTSKERAALRAQAHALSAMVHVGKQGITPMVIESLVDAFRAHELVKIQLTKTADVSIKDAANQLAGKVGADVVQVIGKTATLYRELEEDDER